MSSTLRVAAAATIALFVLLACTVAQQSGPGSTSSPAAAGQNNKGPIKDPNLPPIPGMTAPGVPIFWTYGGSTRPAVFFKLPPADGDYLGFDEKGSLIHNQANGKLYRWNLKENSLTVAGNNLKDIPLDELAAMQNTDQTVQYWLAKNGRGPKQPVTAPQQQPPQNPDKSGGVFGDDPQKTLQGLAPAGGVPADITGKNASIKAGVLTFILPNGASSKPYAVVRPKIMANAPQSAGIAGMWIAMESGGKGIMFTVRADNTVTGKEISPQVVQMLMQGRGQQ
jgi:hypothetical protein